MSLESAFFRVAYRIIRLLEPAIRWWTRRFGLGRIVELRVRGRRSGRERRLLITLLTVGDDRYIGHPNGQAHWVRNLEAAGEAVLVVRGSEPETVRAVLLPPGPERDDAIRATWTQQPLGADLVYRLTRRHVRAHGAYFRLERVPRRKPC